jgi:hypothetical protein
MKPMLAALALVLALTPHPVFPVQADRSVSVGMTLAQVAERLGRAEREFTFETTTRWDYPDMVLVFEKGVLARVMPPTGPLTSKPPSAPVASTLPAYPASASASGSPTVASSVAAAAESTQAFGIFYRKKRFVGLALNTSIFVDGVEIAELDPGTYIKVPIAPGTHSFHSDDEDDAFDVEIAAGEEYYFSVNLKPGMWKGDGTLEKKSKREGSAEFEKLNLKVCKDKAIKVPAMVVVDPRKPVKDK